MQLLRKVSIPFLCMILVDTHASTFNRSLFYRVSSFWDEPRFERDWLTSLDISLLGGSTHRGRNRCGYKTNILSIFGPDHLSSLPGVAPNRATQPMPSAAPDRAHTREPRELSHDKVGFHGVFDVFEADFNLYQTMCYGLFWHLHIPVILAQLYPSGYHPWPCKATAKKYTPLWQQTVELLDSFLEKCNLCTRSLRKAALSDSSLLLGWTHSYNNTNYLDFIDICLQAGALLPTGKKKNERQIFDIPYGYNGHWGFSFVGDISAGACDWFTLGLHADVIAFGDKTDCIRINAAHSTGFLTTHEGKARIKAGPVWRLGFYTKADHFCGPVSLLLAWAYEQKSKDKVYPLTHFKPSSIITSEQFKEWSRWIMHFYFEYDLTTPESFFGPRIGIYYNRELTGKRVFSTHTLGGFLGCDLIWYF